MWSPILLSILVAVIYIPTNSVEVLLFPTTSPAFVVVCVIDVIVLTGVRWNFNVILIYISFMAKDVELFFICLLAIYSSSFENCLFSLFAHLFSELLIL
jgi:hypothetical protein